MQLINSILSTIKRELLYVARDRLYLCLLVVLPLLMILFFTVMFAGGSISSLPVVLVNRDNSEMSRRLVSMVDATKGVSIEYEAVSIDDAEQLMLSGEVVAILFIESGFESNIYRGVPARVECYISGASISASGVVERDIQQAVRTFSAGIALNRLQSLGVSHSPALVDIMPINFHTYTISNPYINYGYYLAPIFMFMGIVIFTVLSTIFAIGRELYYATAHDWIDCASGVLLAGVMGKLLPIMVIMSVMMQLIFFILFVVMGMECSGSYLMLTLGSMLFIVAYQSVAVAIIAIVANLRLALSLGGGYSVMAFTFSGITFPVMSMYGVAQLLSKLFPLTYFSDMFIDQAMRGVPIYKDIRALLFLSVFLILVPLVWRRLQRVVNDNKYFSRD